MRRSRPDPVDVLILGPLPPPFGGVSAYIERARRMLLAENWSIGVLNHFGSTREGEAVLGTLKRNPVRYWLALRRYPSLVVHYHHSRWSTLLVVALARRLDASRRYVITIHGHGLSSHLVSPTPLVAALTRWALAQFDEIVVVSEEIARSLELFGFTDTTLIPAYLGAAQVDIGSDPKTARFLERGRPVLVVAAYRVAFTNDGEDVYGLDLAVEAFCRLSQRHPDLGLCLFVANRPRGAARRYLRRLQGRAVAQAGEERVRVLFEAPLLPTLVHDVVFLRPTRTDGDAVSIREALAMGVPVIASDVVARPPGVQCFATADADALCGAIKRLLERGHAARAANHVTPADGASPSYADAELLARLTDVYARHLAVEPDRVVTS